MLAAALVTSRSRANNFEQDFAQAFYPQRTTQGHDGRFYGSLIEAGRHHEGGLIYALTPAGNFKFAHWFQGITNSNPLIAGGANPEGTLSAAQDGSIYGTTRLGGVFGNGVIYKIDRQGVFSVFHQFEHYNYYKSGVVAAQNGDVFAASQGDESSEIVRVTKEGEVSYATVSGYLLSMVETADHRIVVGCEDSGSAYGSGALWQFSYQTGQFELLARVASSVLSLVPAPDGSLLALTNNQIVQVSSSGSTSLIHQFDAGYEEGPDFLVIAKDGSYLGTTGVGGLGNAGTIFRIIPGTNDFTTVGSLPKAKEEAAPGEKWLKTFGPLREAAVSGNHPPDAMDVFVAADTIQAASGELPSKTISVVPHDRDRDHEPLVVLTVGAAQHGTAALDFVHQKITYTAAAAEVQNDDFTYTIVDGSGGTSVGHVIVRTNPRGEYRGELDSVPNAQTGDPGTNVGSVSVHVDGDRTFTAKVELFGRPYRFAGRFNEANQHSKVLLLSPKKNEMVSASIRLQPNGSSWTVEAYVEKNYFPYAASCTLGEAN